MPDWLAPEFMQRGLIAGLMVALLASYTGVFVVQRNLSFLGSGLAHAAFGGVALGLLLETEPLWVALPFTVIVALAIMVVRERTGVGGDTAVGIFFSVSVALGVVFISLRANFSAEAFSYLFGSIMLVDRLDLWMALAVLGTAILTLPLWPKWAYATFDRELASSDRLPVSLHDYILAVLIAVIIVVSVKLVGIVLIAAFLVIPPATARLVTRTFHGMTIAAIGLSMASVIIGLRLSHDVTILGRLVGWRTEEPQGLPSGATIILVQGVGFLLVMAVGALLNRGRARVLGQ